MKHIFVVNPVAGKGRVQKKLIWDIEKACHKNSVEYEIYLTKCEKDATEFVASKARTGEDMRFYACGGDGTLSEVINGAYRFNNAEVSCIPCGSGNDFVKNFGKAEDFLNIDVMINSASTHIDLIKVNNRISANICSVGLDAKVAMNVSHFKKMPLVSGNLAYNISLVWTLLSRIACKVEISIDDAQSFELKILLAAIANGKYYGGNFFAAPRASLTDGKFDFCIIKSVSRLKIAELVNIYKKGEHLENEKIQEYLDYRQCKKIHIKSKKPIILNIDGECFKSTEINFEILPNSLKFCPPDFELLYKNKK